MELLKFFIIGLLSVAAAAVPIEIIIVPAVESAPSGIDFNKDGTDDLLVRNTSTGQTFSWMMNGNGTRNSYKFIATIPSAQWRIEGTGDYNGDGVTDLLVRNTANGQTYSWLMNSNGTRASYKFITTLPDSNWEIAGTDSHFDDDDISDIIVREKSHGYTYVWLMNSDGSRKSYKHITNLPEAQWEIVGTKSDFNYDDISDIVVREKTHGWTYVWLMNSGGTRGSYRHITNLPEAQWEIAGTESDFNDDGVSDIVVRNKTHGWTYVWLMHYSGARTSFKHITNLPESDWEIAGTDSDFNNDDTSDLVVRNKTTGATYTWLMNTDGSRAGFHHITNIPANDWQIVQTKADFNQDGTSDLVVRNKTTGATYAWLMNTSGTRKSTAHIVSIPASDWEIVGGMDDSSGFNANHTLDGLGDSWTLANGAAIDVPPGAVSGLTSIDFGKIRKPEDLGEEAIVYAYSSDREIQNASFTLPVEFSDISKKDDLELIYVRSEDRAYNAIDFQYNASRKTVAFTINNNWTFENIPESIKESANHSTGLLSGVSSFISSIVLIKKGIIDADLYFPSSKIPIPMPFYTQMGETCWATTGKMLEKSLYAIGQDPGNQIYDFMRILDISIDEGLKLTLTNNEYPRFARVVAGNKGHEATEFYYLVSSVKYRILEQLNQNHPVLFARNGHQVLIVGYTDTFNGIELIQHNPQFYVPGQGMYQTMEFYDSFYTSANGEMDLSLKDAIPTRADATLTWIETDVSPERTLQTVGIPDARSQYKIYFSGNKTTTEDSIRIGFYFNHKTEDGYEWKKSQGSGIYTGGVFPKNIDKFVLQLPVWNADLDNSASVTLAVKIYEENNHANEVKKELSFSLPANSYVQKDFEIDIKPLLASLKQKSNFILGIRLFKNDITAKMISDIYIDDIVLQPDDVESVYSISEYKNFSSSDKYHPGDTGFNPDSADIRLSGSPDNLIIAWTGLNASGVGLFDAGFTALYAIVPEQVGQNIIPSPLNYGDYSIANTKPSGSMTPPAKNLEYDTLYRIHVTRNTGVDYGDYEYATLSFVINRP